MNLQAAVNSLIGLFPTFESRIYLIVTILFVTVLANILARIEWYTIFRHLMLLHAGKQAFVQERKTQKQEKWFLWGLTIVGFFASVYVLWITLTQRPNLLSTSPQQYSVLTTTDTPISIEFDIPVDVKNMTFYTSPEVEGEWRWDYSVLGTMSRKVEFIPQQSFYPGSRITVYMVGLRPVWGAKDQHEMAPLLGNSQIGRFTLP